VAAQQLPLEMLVEVLGSESHLNFFHSIIFKSTLYSEGDKYWTLINQLMGYRDPKWYIKDTWIGFSARRNGQFYKSLKVEKTIAYVFNNVLLNWSIIKEGLRGILSSVFSVCYIREFCKFPGWSLLWTTTVVHAKRSFLKVTHDQVWSLHSSHYYNEV